MTKHKSLESAFAEWFCGNEDAVNFARCLWEVAQQWDDFKDEGTGDLRILPWLAFGKEYHPFFVQHSHIIRPVMLMMQLQWEASNVLDHGTRDDVNKSYMLRAGIYSVFHVMAWVCGGQDWAEKIGPEIYRFYAETPDEIWKEFNDA